ncbi:transglycosylase SLT domain-containing protein [Roseovarius salinarum]|uniref:transglycosylase SLT domain-containing protein n=1 Tax=Roseovarius salinarum TaxID=1981892 RepID=UPI001E63B44C|nr:transglycosylase SLT domain-containing protein [Roseovarius salinarum]
MQALQNAKQALFAGTRVPLARAIDKATGARPGMLSLLLLTGLLAAPVAHAKQPALCDRAAENASAESGVPIDVMHAITRTETGRRRGDELMPWPWAVNMRGQGRWFETRDAASAYLRAHRKNGARNFDVGCFQINYRWHGHAFTSVDQMLEPAANARYAAAFLARLYRETGSWPAAAGAYHSRTPEHARRYKARFQSIRRALAERPAAPEVGSPAVTPSSGLSASANRFPLLQDGNGASAPGSLVSLTDTPARALIKLDQRGEGF